MKPMRAVDAVASKWVKYPVMVLPKVDGVRGCNVTGSFTARTLKKFKNVHVTNLFSLSTLRGLDGEVAAEKETHPRLCTLTTSALGTIKGEPFVLWWIFDYATVETKHLPYSERYNLARAKLEELKKTHPVVANHLRMMPCFIAHSWEEVEQYDTEFLEMGFEGSIVRDMNAPHKDGYTTANEASFGRIKRFISFEFTIDGVIEGESNQNEAVVNALGNTERSSHKANMVPNGMVGALTGRCVADIVDADGNVLYTAGQDVHVGAGCMNHKERKAYFENPSLIVGKLGTAKFFPKGMKDKLRFPVFQSLRDPEEL